MSIKQKGGTVNNPANTTISGDFYGVYIYGGTGTVTNSGTISATEGEGVYLAAGGAVTNRGVISALGSEAFGVDIIGFGTVTNFGGALIEAGWIGVNVTGIATVTNDAGASIVAGTEGILLVSGGTATNAGTITVNCVVPAGGATGIYAASEGYFDADIRIVNTGKIAAGGAAPHEVSGVELASGGSLTNSGTISGTGGSFSYGVYVWAHIFDGGGVSITNSGTISGATAAIKFAGSYANTLTLDTGSVLDGAVIGSASQGATNALVLEGSGTANNAFLNFNTLRVHASGTWTLGGQSTIGSTIVLSGTLDIAGALTTSIAEIAPGSVAVGASATWTVAAASSLAGAFNVGSGAVLNLSGGSLALTDTASFSDASTAGAKTLFNLANTTIAGLAIGNTGGFVNDDTVLESANVVLGDGASITNMAGARWSLTNDAGIALGKSAASSITNFGLFAKTADGGASIIAPTFVNDGKVEVWANSGAIDFHGAVIGTGTDVIFAGAEMEFYSGVAKTQTVDFAGASGSVLFLGAPTTFSAALSGFDSSVSNDAVELLGSWSISGFSTTSTQSTLILNNGSHSASLVFDGSYSKSLFETAVGSTHTTITYT